MTRETLMPTFKIFSCDHLGLKENPQQFSQKQQKNLKQSLAKNMEELQNLEYIYSDNIEKLESKGNKLSKKPYVLVMSNLHCYIFNPKDMSLESHC